MIWATDVQWISVPSAVFCTISLWNAIVYLTFFPLFPLEANVRKKCLLFGLISLSFAVFSFGTIWLYSAQNYEAARFWQAWQFSCYIFVLIFLILFSNSYLAWLKPRTQLIFCLLTLAFLPLIYCGDLFLNSIPAPKTFAIFGHSMQILEVSLGKVSYVFSLWALTVLVTITIKAIKFYRKTHTSISLAIAFLIFVLTVLNDTLVAGKVYHFVYLLEPSCIIYIVAMSIQIFYGYIETSTQVVRKTQEVEELNEEMKFLVGTISHDFTSPLLSIEGFTDMLEEFNVEQNDRFQHYLNRIKYNADHLRSLVGDLSDYLKIGQIHDEISEIKIVAFFKEVLESLHLSSRYPQAKVILPPEEIAFLSSEKRLHQILFNLVENALKYSDPQNQQIELKIKLVNNGVLLILEDSGPGIPNELHEKIFEPFFRNSQKLPGTGLGLAITKKCVEKLKGSVWIESENSTGSRFCIWLPKQQLSGGARHLRWRNRTPLPTDKNFPFKK